MDLDAAAGASVSRPRAGRRSRARPGSRRSPCRCGRAPPSPGTRAATARSRSRASRSRRPARGTRAARDEAGCRGCCTGSPSRPPSRARLPGRTPSRSTVASRPSAEIGRVLLRAAEPRERPRDLARAASAPSDPIPARRASARSWPATCSARSRSERRRTPGRIAVRSPRARSSRVGPCVSSRSACMRGATPLRHHALDADELAVADEPDVDGLRRSRDLRDLATSTLRGGPGAADGSRSTTSVPATASRRVTSISRILRRILRDARQNACTLGRRERRGQAVGAPLPSAQRRASAGRWSSRPRSTGPIARRRPCRS